MRDYIYSPQVNQLDGIMQPINPLMGVSETGGEGWSGLYQSWTMAGIDDAMSPMIRSDAATPTVDMMSAGGQFSMPALNGGLGAVQDALSVLSVVDLLTR